MHVLIIHHETRFFTKRHHILKALFKKGGLMSIAGPVKICLMCRNVPLYLGSIIQGTKSKGIFSFSTSGGHQLRYGKYLPLFTTGFKPSQVVVWDFWSINSMYGRLQWSNLIFPWFEYYPTLKFPVTGWGTVNICGKEAWKKTVYGTPLAIENSVFLLWMSWIKTWCFHGFFLTFFSLFYFCLKLRQLQESIVNKLN